MGFIKIPRPKTLQYLGVVIIVGMMLNGQETQRLEERR